MLWTLPGSFDQKLETAARAGMPHVELVTEWAAWSDAERNAYTRRAQSFGLGIDALLATPDWTKRPVSMVDADHRAAFLADVRKSLEVATRLETPQVILMSGNELAGVPRERQFANLVEAAKRAAELAAAARVTLILEPLNSKVDHKGYFLTSAAEGLRAVKEVDSPHFKLLFDLYHEQVQAGSVLPLAVEAAPHVAVFHVADAPGRSDPGTGAMKYGEIYKAIAGAKYTGYIAMEYRPKGDPVESLKRAVDEMRANI
jgi:hydroxypyruvate isomerase